MEKQDTSSSTSGSLPVVPDQQETIAVLRKENSQLRAELALMRDYHQPAPSEATWETEMQRGIVYADDQSRTSSLSPGKLLEQLSGISKERMKTDRIRNSSDFDYLPKCTSDKAQLEADFVRWGYCLVEDAMSPEQVGAQVDRLVDQAEAERRLNVALMSHHDQGQHVNNLVLKGEVFRKRWSSRNRLRRKARWWIACLPRSWVKISDWVAHTDLLFIRVADFKSCISTRDSCRYRTRLTRWALLSSGVIATSALPTEARISCRGRIALRTAARVFTTASISWHSWTGNQVSSLFVPRLVRASLPIHAFCTVAVDVPRQVRDMRCAVITTGSSSGLYTNNRLQTCMYRTTSTSSYHPGSRK